MASTNGVKPNGNKQRHGVKPIMATTNHGAAKVHKFKMHKMIIGIIRVPRVGRPQFHNCKNSWGTPEQAVHNQSNLHQINQFNQFHKINQFHKFNQLLDFRWSPILPSCGTQLWHSLTKKQRMQVGMQNVEY